MSLKRYKPCTPGLRGKVGIDRSHLWKGSPFKLLTEGYASSGGRNNQGRITIRHRINANKKVYRKICFKRHLLDEVVCEVVRIEHDPNRSAHIALLKYVKNDKEEHVYIIAPKDVQIGQKIETSSSKRIDYIPGNAMKLEYIKDGTIINCLEIKIGKGASLARSAGSFAQVLGKDEQGRIIVKLSSGELKTINKNCFATIGYVSNVDHKNIVLGKAGASFWRGRRPSVRGIAMNPVDHHNGGRANGGTHFASPEGLCAKGKRTRRNKRTQLTIVRRRSK